MITEVYSRTQQKRTLREAFVNEDGAIDLASIMVGIIVIGIIGGVIAATVFAIIPWAQDNAAKESLSAVKTAQSAQKGINEGFSGDLEKFLKDDKGQVSIYAASNYYAAFTKSTTGKTFYFTSEDPTIKSYTTTFPARPANFPAEYTWPLNDADATSQRGIPDLSKWSTVGNATYDKKTGIVKFVTDGDKINSPLIKLGKNKQFSLQVDSNVPYVNATQKYVVSGATYYAEDGKTLIANSSGYTSNGGTAPVASDKVNQWNRTNFGTLGQTGSFAEFPADAVYVQLSFRTASGFSPTEYQIKNPSLIVKDR